jgi:uncharacterized protein
MQLSDVNVLVHALREDSPRHAPCRSWLQAVLDGDEAFGVADLVLSGCIRVATHPRVFRTPTPLDVAVSFVEAVRGQPHAVPIVAGPRHWELFTRLAREAGAKGNLVPDAYLAALAIESGSEWITTDRDFSRFPSLRWRDPTS